MIRNEALRKDRLDGKTFTQIAEKFGISRQRAHQLCSDIPHIRGIRSKINKRIELRIRKERRLDKKRQRFWEKVDVGISKECWNWTAGVVGDHDGRYLGYGRMAGGVFAHRFSWEIHNGREVPRGLQVQHICNNSLCVNPRHLTVGTMWENQRYRDVSGRNGSAKLSPQDVRDIRRRYTGQRGELIKLAEEYGIKQGNTIANVVNRKSYRWIK